MMKLLQRSLTAQILFFHFVSFSQILQVNGAQVTLKEGSVVHCNGGLSILGTGLLTNDGYIAVTKNSSLPENGNFLIQTGSVVSGNGNYRVEQDWVNDASFQANNSTVELFGNTQQFITSNSGVNTTFHDLKLTGSGTGNNRKKTLSGVNATIDATGSLEINDRELETLINDFFHLNTSPNSVTNSTVFGSEGFVSSQAPGYFYRSTNTISSYLFPVGSSNGELRYRPVEIFPNSSSSNSYAVRFNNYDANTDNYDRTTTDGSIFEANDQYYHSIERSSGSSSADVAIYYLPASDGSWTSIAQWHSGQWNSIPNCNNQAVAGFDVLEKVNWSFNPPDHPFILTNLLEIFTIPNVFTPNGDQINDSFTITTSVLKEYNLKIVNRWGNLVYESTDVNQSWDGRHNGELCKEGVYFYTIVATSINDQPITKQGFITLNY